MIRYELRDATGELVAIHERREQQDGTKKFMWRQPDGSPGLAGTPVAALPLYGIERLTGSTTVLLVEGEKATDALLGIRVQAVGTITGASGAPGPGPLAELSGRRVLLWPDNDEVGRTHMQRIGAGLAGIADDVRWIDWPDAPAHGDAADFIAAGGTSEDALALVNAARPLPPLIGHRPQPAPSEAWDPPLSLDRSADLPTFPVTSLPGWLRSFVVAEAEATQTPVDMAAMFVLAALATVAAGHVQVEPVPGWCEGLNVFIAVAMEPGSRKSAVHRDVVNPIVAYEQLLVEQAQPGIAEQATIRRIAEASLAKTEKAAAAAKDPSQRSDLEEQARTYASALDRLDVPAAPRLFTADVTPEKLASLLHENQGRMAVLSAEGGVFDIMAGRYSAGMPNIDVYLQGHAGDPIRVDRRGRPPEFINRPAVTIGLAVQPFVLAKAARVGDFGGRGLFDRFLYSIPPSTVGYRQTNNQPMPDAIRQLYDTTLRALAASFERFSEPMTLRLDHDASALFSAWRAEIEPRRRPSADLGHIQGWSSKLDGAVVRVAGLLHLAETITSSWNVSVSRATMSAALEIGDYLIAHALAAFDHMGADPRLDAARRIGLWVVAGRHAAFTKREAFRALRGQAMFPTVERLTAGLDALEDHAWVRKLPTERHPGRPHNRYEANPAIFVEAWTKRPELGDSTRRDDVLSILSVASDGRDAAPSEPQSGIHEPEVSLRPVAPGEPAELGDWLAAPLIEPDGPWSDEWGTIG